MNLKLLALAVIVILVAFGAFILFSKSSTSPLLGAVHIHSDFKVFIDGQSLNFSQTKYMSTNLTKLSNFVHLHDGDGDIIHAHISGVTLGEFFRSVKMSLNSTCFSTENQTFCNNGQKQLKMYVNGAENNEFASYVLNDLDRVLVTYGTVNLTQELNSVTDKACIPSGKCPERGIPENESSCLTGSDCIV